MGVSRGRPSGRGGLLAGLSSAIVGCVSVECQQVCRSAAVESAVDVWVQSMHACGVDIPGGRGVVWPLAVRM